MVNVANAIVLSIAAISIVMGLLLAMRRRRVRQSVATPVAPIPTGVTTFSGVAATASPSRSAQTYRNPATPEGRIVSSYYRAARLLESGLAITFQPHFTLRGFLRAIGLHMGSAFAELTQLAERALYSFQNTDESEALHAEELAKAVEEEGV